MWDEIHGLNWERHNKLSVISACFINIRQRCIGHLEFNDHRPVVKWLFQYLMQRSGKFFNVHYVEPVDIICLSCTFIVLGRSIIRYQVGAVLVWGPNLEDTAISLCNHWKFLSPWNLLWYLILLHFRPINTLALHHLSLFLVLRGSNHFSWYWSVHMCIQMLKI